jgi:hypothetical protein
MGAEGQRRRIKAVVRPERSEIIAQHSIDPLPKVLERKGFLYIALKAGVHDIL